MTPQTTKVVEIDGERYAVNSLSSPKLRFWSNVDKNGPEHPTLGRCWLWTASKNRRGYGKFVVRKKSCPAHRYSWILHIGNIPLGLCVLHRCDNPSCVNPDHLFIGTDVDNIADRDSKGRQCKGEDTNTSKLSEDDVRWVRQHHVIGDKEFGTRGMARKLGVTPLVVRSILQGKSWKHVT